MDTLDGIESQAGLIDSILEMLEAQYMDMLESLKFFNERTK